MLVVEVHFYMHTIATDGIQQGTQLVKCHPARHDALATSEDLPVEVIPFGRTSLRFSHAGCPLDGIQLFYLEQGIEMVHSSHAVEMVEGIVYLLALLTDERLHKAAIVVYTDHCGDVALQL